MLQYKGYEAQINGVDEEEGTIHGQIMGIADVIGFEGASVEELKAAFQEAVDDYLQYCRQRKRRPDKPYSGRFVLRVPPELHRSLAHAAQAAGMSLNALISMILEAHSRPAVSPGRARTRLTGSTARFRVQDYAL